MSRAQNQLAYDQLRRLLIHGQVAAGQRLTEAEWAQRLGVHRAALREAMMVLAHEGLLRRGERGGYFVPSLTGEELEQVLQVRAILETGAIRLIGERPPAAEETDQLGAVCDAMDQMLEQGYDLGFVEADRRFHRTLIELSGNDRLRQLYARAPLPLLTAALPDRDERLRRGRRTVAEHRQIMEHLAARQIDQAVAVLETHLHRTHRVPAPA